MNIDTDRLQRKIDTRNKVNKKANELQAEFTKLLQPFVGKKVIKVTPYRQWTKQVGTLLREQTSVAKFAGTWNGSFRLSWDFYCYTVCAAIDTCYGLTDSPGSPVEYVKQEFAVCRLDGNCDGTSITGLPDPANFRTDYTLDEVVQKMTELSELEAKVADIKGELREFISQLTFTISKVSDILFTDE
jgi:hypothetical protein